MKYIDAELLRKEIEEERKSIEGLFIEGDNNFYDGQDDAYNHTLALIDSLQQEQDLIVINKKDWEAQEQFQKNQDFGKPLQQEQPTLNESQQEFVNTVTERMLKEGPIPTLKGKQKAEFEKEFNRFKQITGMINFPAHMEIYKKVILWFMAWGADNLPNLNKATNSDELDFQQEQPGVELEKEIIRYRREDMDRDTTVGDVARHFYGLRNHALEEAARHVYESWMGGTMDDVRRDMVELGKALNAIKEERQ